MSAERAIENLLYLYAERIDAGDLEGQAELFRDAEIVSSADGQRIEGYKAFLHMERQFVRIHADGTPRTQHVTTNARIEIDASGETASATSCFTVLQATDTLPLQPIIAGRYEDRFAKRDGQWHFTRRTMIPVLHGDLSQHLLVSGS